MSGTPQDRIEKALASCEGDEVALYAGDVADIGGDPAKGAPGELVTVSVKTISELLEPAAVEEPKPEPVPKLESKPETPKSQLQKKSGKPAPK